jgi:bifunctional non-homologous end joining protein LigD
MPPTRRAAPLAEYRRKRDFDRTAEPAGDMPTPEPRGRELAYIIQKHEATRLHYDLRLELDGVMKSWAVPKGPSLDPSVRRLAMHVEDHPIEYNKFEGTIPAGEYGGGTVMLWDRGTYTYAGPDDGDPIEALRRAYEKGDYKFELNGERLRGSFVLVRMRRDGDDRQWLLIKHRDALADASFDPVAEYQTSVVTGRSMEEIANGVTRAAKKTSTKKTSTKKAASKKTTSAKKTASAKTASAKKTSTKKRA